ncbi:condensation domain-containing protein [Rheinheimera baltica]|uniref:Condensation domain-containing protein n=1 Tax=Rheinheimera baltica TaxID=67576 RepID=A0ABT9HUE9_9GAMM|nr:condensation domain-containing protein [Rheinheimera baltica]MDP5134752.1 condensation domain-containing protein [Rheinheimera baltica]
MTQTLNWLPLSETQLDFWLLNRLNREQYLLDFFVEINQVIDVNILEECVNQVVCKHNIFWLKQHRFLPFQKQVARRRVTLQKWDLTAYTQEEQQVRISQQLEQLYDSDIIASLPMVQIGFFRLAEHKYLLFLLVPHLCADATSMQIITSEMLYLYRYRSAGMEMDEIQMDEPYQFQQYLEEELFRKQQYDKYQQSLSYWTALFAQADPLWLSSKWLIAEDDETISFSGDLSYLDVDAVFEKLNECGLTKYLGLVSLVSVAMHRLSGQSNFVVTALFNTRTELPKKRMVGPAYRELYFLPEFSNDEKFTRTLASVKEQFDKGMRYKHCEEALTLYLIEQKKWPRLVRKLLLPLCEWGFKLLTKTILRNAKLSHKVLSYYLLYYLYPGCRKLVASWFDKSSSRCPVELEVNYIDEQDTEITSSSPLPTNHQDFEPKCADDRFSGYPYLSVSFFGKHDQLTMKIDGNDLKRELKQLLFDTLKTVMEEFLHGKNVQPVRNQMKNE